MTISIGHALFVGMDYQSPESLLAWCRAARAARPNCKVWFARATAPGMAENPAVTCYYSPGNTGWRCYFGSFDLREKQPFRFA